MAVEKYDCVIVGTGWFGLGAARAYIATHPGQKVRVFEANETVGGTWSKGRLYPGLKSNNMIGTYEFPDFPMSYEKYGVEPGGHIPGTVLHRYLTEFAQEFGIYERIQFKSSVSLVECLDNEGWNLTVTSPEGRRQVETAKLILATGLTSTPYMPTFEGAETFGKPLFHAKDFCRRANEVEGSKNVTVVGGAKSAYDVAYAMVEGGATVDLIIKSETIGPVWIAPRYVTPLKLRVDTTLSIRCLTLFSPCPWGNEDGHGLLRWFLHSTFFGRLLVKAFWKSMSGDVLSQIQYDNHPELKKLKPWHPMFWIGSGLSILNFEKPIFDLVRQGKIRVHIDNISRLEPAKVVLETGKTLDADSMICSTGWKKDSTIKFAGLPKAGLGLPVEGKELEKLNSHYDAHILKRFPMLKAQPTLRFTRPPSEPLRYYRFMVPPVLFKGRTLAYAGMISSVTTALCATMQGLWISAYMDGNLNREAKTEQDMIDEIMKHTQWGRWRYPCGYGATLPDFVFEGVPYLDMLMKDLGLSHKRKPWYKDLFSAYTPQDYYGVVDEWNRKQKS